MKFIKRYLIMLLLLATFSDAISQNSQVLYYMNLPQNHLLNPALRPSNSTYIGLPGLTGVNVKINNNFLNYSDVLLPGLSGDSALSFLHKDFDIEKFMSKLGPDNFINPEATVQLFGLGLSAGKDLYIFMDYNLRSESTFRFPKEMFELFFKDLTQYVGKSIDLSVLQADAKVYNEFGLGFSKNITDRFRIGIKGKYLIGIAAVSLDTKTLNASISNDLKQTLNADLLLRIVGPMSIPLDSENHPGDPVFYDTFYRTTKGATNTFLSTKNSGFGADIGAVVNLTDRLTISAAVTDIGMINWTKDDTTLHITSNFKLDGLNMIDVYNGTISFDALTNEILDSLRNSIVFTKTSKPFTTYLPLGITVGGSFNLTKSVSLGVVSYTRFVANKPKEALTLSANFNLGNLFSASMAYTTANNRYDNLGVGIAFRAGCIQIYALADRIPLTWAKVDKTPVPQNWNTIHAMAGINLVFGNKVSEKKDKPMILVQ